MRKNFLDTQTGGTSDSASQSSESSQKTDLSPREISNMKQSIEETPPKSQSLNIDANKPDNAEERVDAVEEGKTTQPTEDVSAENSTPNNILSEYEETKEEAEEDDEVSSIINTKLRENNITEDELVSMDDINQPLPTESLTKLYTLDSNGNKIPVQEPQEYFEDEEVAGQYPMLEDGSFAQGELSLSTGISINQNRNSPEGEPLVSFEGVPVRNQGLMPKEVVRGLKGEENEPKPNDSYYTLRSRRFLKDENGNWFEIGHSKRRFNKRNITDEDQPRLKPVTARMGFILEDNATWAFSRSNASESASRFFALGAPFKTKRLRDIGEKDAFGRVITEKEVVERRKKEEQKEREFQRDFIYQGVTREGVEVKRFRNFRYGQQEVEDLRERISKKRKDKSPLSDEDLGELLKDDGEYTVGARRYAKKDGKWYRVVKQKSKSIFQADRAFKEIKYDKVSRLEANSFLVEKNSKDYLRASLFSTVEDFELRSQKKIDKYMESVKDATIDKLINSKDFSTEPVFDFLNETAKELNIKMTQEGFTTAAIEEAEMNLKSTFGDILNDRIQERMIDFELSTEALFMPNPYSYESAAKNLSATFPRLSASGIIAGKEPEDLLGEDGFNPSFNKTRKLTSAEVEMYKGMGYVGVNNTTKPPEMPGLYFLGMEYATKVDNFDGTQSWIDQNGDVITDTRKKALYESSSTGGQEFIEVNGYKDSELMINMAYQGESVNVKETKLYGLLFNNPDLLAFVNSGSSELSTDDYFIALKKANLSGQEYYGTSDILKSLTGNGDLSTADRMDDASIAFVNKLHNAIEEYNEFKNAEASVLFFAQNASKFKSRYPGADKESFDKAVDAFAEEGVVVALDRSMTAAERGAVYSNIKKRIVAWKKNTELTNDKLNQISRSGMSVSNYLFQEKQFTIATLGNIGNSTSLRRAKELYTLNKELLDLVEYSNTIKIKSGTSDLSMSGLDESRMASVNQRISEINDQIELITQEKSAESIGERAGLIAKSENLNKTIPFLESIFYGDYTDEDANQFEFADIPKDLHQRGDWPIQKQKLAFKILTLKKTRDRVASLLKENEDEANGFFRTSSEIVIDSLAGGEKSLKPFLLAIPDIGSSKDKFDMLFTLINGRRIELEGKLNLDRRSALSRANAVLDLGKDFTGIGLSEEEKEYYDLVYKVRTLTPLYLNNQIATRQEQNGFYNSIWSGITSMVLPNISKAMGEVPFSQMNIISPLVGDDGLFDANITSPKETLKTLSGEISKMQKQLPEGGKLEITKKQEEGFQDLVDYGFTEDSLWSRDFWGHTVGVTTGIIGAFYAGNASYSRMGKIIVGFETFLRANKINKAKYTIQKGVIAFQETYNSIMSRNRITKYLISPSLVAATHFKSIGILGNEKLNEELTFTAGALGGLMSQGFLKGFPFLGRKVRGMTKAEYQQMIRGIYGSDANRVRKIIKGFSQGSGFGTAEMSQELGEELAHAWERSENGTGFFKELEAQFGTLNKALKFAVSTFTMGVAFGIGSKGGLSDAIGNLNQEEFEVYESVTNTIKENQEAAIRAGENSRKESMQSDVNAANAIESQNTEASESKAKEDQSESSTQEEQTDPAKKFNEQKKSRRDWQKESNSEEIIDDLQKRSENNEFVEGTTEENVLEVYNTLTEEQQNEVKNMSSKGNLIRKPLVYEKIFMLAKANAESKSLDQKVDELTKTEESSDSEMLYDPAEEIEIIQEYENQLSEDNKESIKLDEEMTAIEQGVDPNVENEMNQTTLQKSGGEVTYTSEEGRTLEEEMEIAYLNDQIDNYNNLADVNKESLREKAREQLAEEKNKKEQRNKRVKGRKGKKVKFEQKNRKERRESDGISELEIEQRAKKIYEEFVETRSKITLGPATASIETERATLNYNQESSDQTGSIVYDMSNESGLIGQVSGSFNSDGDFVVENMTFDKSSGNYNLEALSGIAENVKGDIILPGTSKVGKQLHNNGDAFITEDGNYLVPNTENSPTQDQGKIRAGDRLRNLKIIFNQDGITLNSGPGPKAYNAAIEIAAKIMDAGGATVRAYNSAKKAYKNSKYYKNLSAEKQIQAMVNIENALQETLTSDEFMEIQRTTESSINAAVKAFQKNSEVYKSADRKQKVKLTKEFKKNLQEKIESEIKLSKEDKAKGKDMLNKVKKERTRFEDKMSIKTKALDLKNRFKSMKEGQKVLDDLKKQVTDYAKKNLPKGKYSKAELESVMNQVKNAKTPQAVEDAFDKIDRLAEKKTGQDLEQKRKKTKNRIKPSELNKLIPSKKSKKGKVDATTMDEIKSFISQVGGMEAVAEMNLEEIDQFNEVLDGLVSEGKADYKAARNFIQNRKRRVQGSAIEGFSNLIESQRVEVNSVQDIINHINGKLGNFILIDGKYYNRTDFKENQAEIIKEFKEGKLPGYTTMSADYNAATGDSKAEILEEFKSGIGSISFKDIPDGAVFKAYKARPQDVQAKEGRRKRRYGLNPFTAAMDFDGLAVKMWSGGNNQLKDFMESELIRKIPVAFTRTSQDTFDISNEHMKALNEIFGRSSSRVGAEDAYRSVVGGQMKTPLILRSQAKVIDEEGNIVNPFDTQENLTNDNLVHIYNMSRNPRTRKRLIEGEEVNVEAIDRYMNSSNKDAVMLKKYADWLMNFYKTKAPGMYESAYERYSSGKAFGEIKAKNEEGVEETVDYYPITARVEQRGVEQSIADLIESGDFRGLVKSINPSAFQERTNRGGINIMKGASEVFSDYNYQNTRMKHFADVVDAAQTLFGNPALKQLLVANAGRNTYNKFEESISDIIKGEPSMDGKIPVFASILNSMGVLGTLSLKPQQVIKQATSFMHFWGAGIEMGLRGENPGFIGKNPFAASFGLVNDETRAFERAVLNSAFIRQRWQGAQSIDLDIKRAAEAAKKSGGSTFDNMLNSAGGFGVDAANMALLTTRMGDMAGVLFGPGGGLSFAVNLYNKFKKDGMSNEEATQRAIEKFSEVASKTQQSTQVNTLSATQKQLLFRMGGMYRTSQGAAAKKTMAAVNRMFDKTNKSKKEKAQIVHDFLYFGIVSPMLFTAISTGAVMSMGAAFDLVETPALAADDQEKVRKRHLYDWGADNVQSLMQGYGYGGIVADHIMNVARDREYFNSVPILKMLDRFVQGAAGFSFGNEKDVNGSNPLRDAIDFMGAGSNVDQMAELFDLLMKDEKDWRRILNKTMNWQTRYMQPGFDYGRDDKIYESIFSEGYMEGVTPVSRSAKRPQTNKNSQTNKKPQAGKTVQKKGSRIGFQNRLKKSE